MTDKNLRIAIQKSGRLSDKSQELLSQCGLKLNWKSSRLSVIAENSAVEILRLRDDDIPGLVMEGLVDIGIVGENVLEESRLERSQLHLPTQVKMLRQLDFGRCKLCIAVPEDSHITSVAQLHNLRIASSYPQLLKQYLDQHNVQFKPCSLSGSVEVAPKSGLADAICDLVSSGATLEVNGLKNLLPIFESQCCLIQQQNPLATQKQTIVDKLMPRIQSIIQARESKYIMLHAPKQSLKAITDLLPGAENPTILPLAGKEDIVALHMVSSETLFWETMEQLKQLGASSILVLPIEKMME